MSPRISFDTELKNLEQAIMEMSEQVEHAYIQLVKGLENRNEYLLMQVMEGDHAVSVCEWEEFQETGIIEDYRIL